MQNISGIGQIKSILKVPFRVDICILCVLGRYLMNKTPVPHVEDLVVNTGFISLSLLFVVCSLNRIE